jgi:hypothetical protein
MIVSRKNLLAKLRIVKPALNGSELVLFDGQRIVATNDGFAIAVPQPGDFRGAVEWARLLDLLATSKATAVKIQAANGNARVMFDGTVITLPMSGPPEHFNFPMLSLKRALQSVPAAFLHAVEHCLRSIKDGPNLTVPEQLGVTLIPEKRDSLLWLYSADQMTLRYACLTSSPIKLKQRAILSAEFCRQMLRLAASTKTWRIDIEQGLFLADDVLLHGDGIYPDNPQDFVRTVQRHMPTDYDSEAIPVPKGLAAAAQELAVITVDGGRHSDSEVGISITDGIATFEAESDLGAITKQLRMPRHPDVRATFKVSLLCEACTWAERILFTKNSIIMNSGPHFYLCAATPSPTVRPRRRRELRRSNSTRNES